MTKRLVYIDCLRGLAMLMVVYSHVLSFSMGGIQPSPIGQWMRDVMLPLFFLISGFCAYKKDFYLSIGELRHQIRAKTRSVLIPTVVMFLLYMLYCYSDVLRYATVYDKAGYWFTWVLFQIFVIYYLTLFIAGLITNKYVRTIILCSPIAIMWIIGHFVGYSSETAIVFEWIKVKQYYMFFLVGLFLREYQDEIMNFIARPIINCLLLIGGIAIYCVDDQHPAFGGG